MTRQLLFRNRKKTSRFLYYKRNSGRTLDYLDMEVDIVFIVKEEMPKELHPGQSALISVNNDVIGIIGKVHPQK